MSQSLAIEAYVAGLAPRFAVLSPQQRAVDRMYAGIKEDMLVGCARAIFTTAKDNPEQAKTDITNHLDKFFAVLEEKVPEAGFVLGLEFPTAADLAVLNTTTGYMPFGAAVQLAGYDLGKWKKVAALCQRVKEHKNVADYVSASPFTLADPFGFAAKFGGSA
eukprot:SRR837773.23052.p2 GENE.SRR837773.23052~~SRR837773.23052.p2  ORF type:complete len:162 (+),score=76.79 SRR837773.23052:1-486(+)